MLSVIIPAYNEEKALPRTLNGVCNQPCNFEIILVDGGSNDNTIGVAHRYPGIRVISAKKGRASQMNAGADIASGEWLLFLHADTLLPEFALNKITSLDNNVLAGGFRQAFSGDKWSLRMISWLHNIRFRRTRVMYGDQAMFIRRKFFVDIGGFPDRSILEDIAISEKIIALTEPVLLNMTVTTDSRKFISQGIWRSLWRVIMIQICVELRRPLPDDAKMFFRDIR